MAWHNTLIVLLMAAASAIAVMADDKQPIAHTAVSTIFGQLEPETISLASRQLQQLIPAQQSTGGCASNKAKFASAFRRNRARAITLIRRISAPGGATPANCVAQLCLTVKIYKEAGAFKTPVPIQVVSSTGNRCKGPLTSASVEVLGADLAKRLASLYGLCVGPVTSNLAALSCGGQVTLF